MKNYFVQTLCKVNEANHKPGQDIPIHEKDVFPLYQQMQKLSYSTFKKFMAGDWEYVLLEKSVDHVFDVFKNNFREIHKLAQDGDANILFCGLDAQMLRPTEIFGKWDKFMMFNHSDPKRTAKFENNFNCDVRYYPASLDKKWWDYTIEKLDTLKVWSDEQDIYNDILWGQGVNVNEVCHPELAFQGFMMPSLSHNVEVANRWNNTDINNANIVHWHSSRSLTNRIELMTDVCRRLNVDIID